MEYDGPSVRSGHSGSHKFQLPNFSKDRPGSPGKRSPLQRECPTRSRVRRRSGRRLCRNSPKEPHGRHYLRHARTLDRAASVAQITNMSTEQDNLCPACNTGHLYPRRIDYTIPIGDGLTVKVPNLLVEVCDHCGESVLSADASDAVDAVIADQSEELTTHEVEQFREGCGVDQTEMSEILGLGGKTYHRWEKGNQVVSRSMGYYLRVLAEFPEAFQWLRDRGWRRKNRIQFGIIEIDFSDAFPDLAATKVEPVKLEVPSFNPAKALFGKVA